MIGSLFSEVRSTFGWSQDELARRFGACGVQISRQAISKWESGRGNPCREDVVRALRILYTEAALRHNRTHSCSIPTELQPYQIGVAVLAASAEVTP